LVKCLWEYTQATSGGGAGFAGIKVKTRAGLTPARTPKRTHYASLHAPLGEVTSKKEGTPKLTEYYYRSVSQIITDWGK
jgi:hypothetical protein